jgi:hypothetical protein
VQASAASCELDLLKLEKSRADQGLASTPRESADRYAFKASLIGSAHELELTDGGLSWQAGGKSGFWRYLDISAIRLSYRPVSMQSRRFRADIVSGGQRMAVLSTTWQTVALMSPQDREYRDFITQLHARMQQAGSKAALSGGIGRASYTAGLVVLALVGIAVAGLLIRAMLTGEFVGGLFLVGFAVLFAWQIGGFVMRNRPCAYAFGDLPKALLP